MALGELSTIKLVLLSFKIRRQLLYFSEFWSSHLKTAGCVTFNQEQLLRLYPKKIQASQCREETFGSKTSFFQQTRIYNAGYETLLSQPALYIENDKSIPYTREIFISINFRHFCYLRQLILKVANSHFFLFFTYNGEIPKQLTLLQQLINQNNQNISGGNTIM